MAEKAVSGRRAGVRSGRTGNHSKLTPSVRRIVVTAIKKGNTLTTAAQLAGVARNTLWVWLTHPDPAYRDFQNAVEKAEGDATRTSVSIIRTAAQTQWQAAAWWLERRHHEEWGRTEPLTPPINVDARQITTVIVTTPRPPQLQATPQQLIEQDNGSSSG